jgi:hypothetical protein
MNTAPTAIRVFGANISVFSCTPGPAGGFGASDIHLRCDLDDECLHRNNALRYAAERGDFVQDHNADSNRSGRTTFILNIYRAQ